MAQRESRWRAAATADEWEAREGWRPRNNATEGEGEEGGGVGGVLTDEWDGAGSKDA